MNISVLVTHDNCADGLASAMVALDACPNIKVVFAQYNQPSLEELQPAEGMVFCDITPPRTRVRDFVDAGAWCLDHHKHARDIVDAFGKQGHFADEVERPGWSGALLAYAHIWVPQLWGSLDGDRMRRISDFARLAGIRDTWQNHDPDWELAQDLHATLMGLPRGHWLRPGGVERAMSGEWLTLGKMFRAQRADQTRAICERGCIREDGWAFFPGTGAVMSDTAEALRGEGVRIALGWFQVIKAGEIQTVCSLRSDGSLDVGALCKRFGGGGHSRAAGCTLPYSDAWEAVNRIRSVAREMSTPATAGSTPRE